jgi:hypothetical protein
MSINRASLVAMGMGLLFCTVASPARADQISTGYGAFRMYSSGANQQCVGEYWGAAINFCGTQDFMIFEVPIPDTGLVVQNWQIAAVSYEIGGYGPAAPWGCSVIALSPNQNTLMQGGYVTFGSGTSTKAFTINNVPNGWAIRLQCQNIPQGRGIKNLHWGPI